MGVLCSSSREIGALQWHQGIYGRCVISSSLFCFLISWIINSSASVIKTMASSFFFFFFFVSQGFQSGFYMSESAAAAAIFRSDLMLGILNPRKTNCLLSSSRAGFFLVVMIQGID